MHPSKRINPINILRSESALRRASAFEADAAGILGGMIAGGLIGGAVGNRMDAADRREANRATYSALNLHLPAQPRQMVRCTRKFRKNLC